MSGAYMADGRRRSSMTHATRGHKCSLCSAVPFGNGGKVSHGRGHVRRGEAIELMKYFAAGDTSRFFFAPDDPHVSKFLSEGYQRVED